MNNRYNKYDELVAPWKNDSKMRQILLQRIRENSNGLNNAQALFTEDNILEEYYKMWLELPSSAVLQRVAQHPLLTKKHKAQIDERLAQQKTSQIKWASGGTAVTLLLYSIFFSRMAGFRNFFNNQNSWAATRILKKTVGTYGVFLCWVISLNSSYQKALPKQFEQNGLCKELGILGKPSNN